MPTVFKIKGYRFFFFSNEGNEAIHIHVEKAEKYAKFWLQPIALSKNYDFNSSELGEIEKIIKKNISKIERSWNEYFNYDRS